MSDDPKPGRRDSGRWPKGVSGNHRGRPERERLIPHPEQARDMVYELGLFPITVNINGESYEVPLITANYLTLGTKGAKGDVRSAQKFVDWWCATVETERKHIADLEKRFDGLWPAYQSETDPVKRAELKKQWDEVAREMAGMRRRRSEPFPPRKRRRRRRSS